MHKRQEVMDYYKSIESYFGYRYLNHEVKHFGFYPDGVSNISEREAQRLMSDQVGVQLQIKKGDKILDAGCGYGVTACYLSQEYGANIVGIDLNQFELKRARQRADAMSAFNRPEFINMDYTQLAFANSTFDAIYTLETLSHSPNLLDTLHGFYKALKPGGKIALFEYTLAPMNQFSEYEKKMLEIGIVGTAAFGLKEFKHDEFVNTLKSVGFKNTNEENITDNMMPSLNRLKKIAYLPYQFISLLGWQQNFVNATIAVEWQKLMAKDLIRYCIFTATK